MDCPRCKGSTRVIKTTKYETVVSRGRECKECGFIFHTNEESSSNKYDPGYSTR